MLQFLRLQTHRITGYVGDSMENLLPTITTNDRLSHALTLTRMAQSTKSPEMLKQHLDAIERHLEYVIRNTEEADCDR